MTPRLVPSSVKRPNWALLGPRRLFATGPVQVQVHGAKLVVYGTAHGELRVAYDSCLHRGGSLSKGHVCGDDIVCPNHSRAFGMASAPKLFLQCAVCDGLAWVDYSSDLFTQHFGPPSSALVDAREHAKTLQDVNPVLLVEKMLEIPGHARVQSWGPRGRAKHVFCVDRYDVTVDTEYHVPFTVSTTYRFCDRVSGDEKELCTWCTVTPTGAGRVQLYYRVSRGWLSDWMVSVLEQDADVVSTLDAASWRGNRLGLEDRLIGCYRDAMADVYPEILEYYVRV